jgi:predicted cupin superfamily sugar epimerase
MSVPELARILGLQAHPEGGWFKETYRSAITVDAPGYDGPRAVATAILYLLDAGETSAPHVVASDEIWLWHRGGTLELTIGDDVVMLGGRIEDGEVTQVVVPGGAAQAARPASDEAVLVSCIVAPGFDFGDFRLL